MGLVWVACPALFLSLFLALLAVGQSAFATVKGTLVGDVAMNQAATRIRIHGTKSREALLGLAYSDTRAMTEAWPVCRGVDVVEPARSAADYVTDGVRRVDPWALPYRSFLHYDLEVHPTSQNGTSRNPASGSLGFVTPAWRQIRGLSPSLFTRMAVVQDHRGLIYDREELVLGTGQAPQGGIGLRAVQRTSESAIADVFGPLGDVEFAVETSRPNSTHRAVTGSGAMIYHHADGGRRECNSARGAKIYLMNAKSTLPLTMSCVDSEFGNDYVNIRHGRFPKVEAMGPPSSPKSSNRRTNIRHDDPIIVMADTASICRDRGQDSIFLFPPSVSRRCRLGDSGSAALNDSFFTGQISYCLKGGEVFCAGYSSDSTAPVESNYTDAQDQPILDPPRTVAAATLAANNSCSRFFNDSPYLTAGIVDLGAPGLTADQALASDRFIAVFNMLPNTGAATTAGAGFGLNAVIQVNGKTDGPFLSSTAPSGSINMLGGVFTSASLAGEATQLLHEIAHTLRLIPDDVNALTNRPFSGMSQINTNTIIEKCAVPMLYIINSKT